MHILFVGSELTPIVKVGGLGDVMGALPKALEALGVDVSIIIPCYGFIPKKNLKLIASSLEVPLARKHERIALWETTLPESRVSVFLIENQRYFGAGSSPYYERSAFAGTIKEMQRFAFFSKAVFELLRNRYLEADIVHANDWHSGALITEISKWKLAISKNPQLLITNYKLPKTIFTIHNLGNQGRWNVEEIDNWFFARGEKKIFASFRGEHNFITEGIMNADFVTTVSPTYAKEILTKEYGAGLEKILQKRRKNLTGILNGIDYDFFNPSRDGFLFKRYGRASVQSGKTYNKAKLLSTLGLRDTPRAPLFGLVSRLTEQKGIDLLVRALPSFLEARDGIFIFLGRGSSREEAALRRLEERFPRRVFVKIGFDEELAHRIYAASDFFLMPSRFEPSGLGQMIAMRYGTIPIVRRTGGLKDSVEDMRTGLVFGDASAVACRAAIVRAWDLYSFAPERFQAMRELCLRQNFDFMKSARAYQALYRKVLAGSPR